MLSSTADDGLSVLFSVVSKTNKLQQSRHRIVPDQYLILNTQDQSQSTSIVRININININSQHQAQSPSSQPHLTSQPKQINQTTTMSSANWEQHFLDKFIASSSRPTTPTSSQPQPRNASPARWRPSARYNDLPTPRSSGSDRVATNTTSAAR
jgi:hypothetical protein